jgi:hypothetical protein
LHADFRDLADKLAGFSNPSAPSPGERAAFFDAAFRALEAMIEAGAKPKHAKRALRNWLSEHCEWLSRKPDTLKRQMNRDFRAWRAGGRRIGTLVDGRSEANKARKRSLPKEDYDSIIGTALYRFGGQYTPAVITLLNEGKLSEETRGRFSPDPARISGVAHSIRREIAPAVNEYRRSALGPRAARLDGAYITQEWEDVPAGDVFSADDFTLEVYFARPDGGLSRGQWLPMIDARSKRILAANLIPEQTYTATDVLELIASSVHRVGLPRKKYIFENGLWRKAKALGGGALLDGVHQNFADRLGVRIHHTQPGNPRGKAFLENAGKLFQARLRDVFGWCGPNEQVTRIESVQKAKLDVAAGRKTAAEAGFLTFEQWSRVLDSKIEEYNARPQDSRVMGGLLSPDEAWERHQERNSDGKVVPLVRLPDDLLYLVASHQEDRTVGGNGISFTVSGHTYRYRSEELASFRGRTLKTYWDPQHPEILTCAIDCGETLIVPRNMDTPANATREELSAAMADKNRCNKRYAGRLAEFRDAAVMPPTRHVICAREDLERGRIMRAECDGRKETERQNAQRASRTQRRAQTLGIPSEFARLPGEATERGLELIKEALSASSGDSATDENSDD